MTPAESPYHVEWTGPAKRAMGRLPEKVAYAAIELIHGPLAENPQRMGRALKLELEGRHSAHRGDYRVIYRIDARRRVIYIETIQHRSDAYRPR